MVSTAVGVPAWSGLVAVDLSMVEAATRGPGDRDRGQRLPGGVVAVAGKVGDAACAVDDEIVLDPLALPAALGGGPVAPVAPLDCSDRGDPPEINTKLPPTINRELDEVRVDVGHRSQPTVDDDGGTADEQEPWWQEVGSTSTTAAR